MTTEQVESSGSATVFKRRKPWLAGFLSLLFPGLGFVYCGHLAIAAIYLVLGFIGLFAVYSIILCGPGWMLAIYLPWIIGIGLVVGNVIWAWQSAKRQPSDYVPKLYNRFLFYLLWPFVLAGTFLAFQYLVGQYEVYIMPASSMENCINTGERFIVDLDAYHDNLPNRGDVIIFVWPGDNVTKYIKRCVALPGDTVRIVDKILYINGTKEHAPPTLKYIDTASDGAQNIMPPDKQGKWNRDNFGPYIVGPLQLFVLGDNRDNSYDSRFWGPVPTDLLVGKAIRIISSPDRSRVGTYIRLSPVGSIPTPSANEIGL